MIQYVTCKADKNTYNIKKHINMYITKFITAWCSVEKTYGERKNTYIVIADKRLLHIYTFKSGDTIMATSALYSRHM